jgi:hypothetical protein
MYYNNPESSRDLTLQEFNTLPRVATHKGCKFLAVAYFARHDPHKETKRETRMTFVFALRCRTIAYSLQCSEGRVTTA